MAFEPQRWIAEQYLLRAEAGRGFCRTGPAIKDAFKSAINAALRRGRVESARPDLLRKVR